MTQPTPKSEVNRELLISLAQMFDIRGKVGGFVIQTTGDGFANIGNRRVPNLQIRVEGDWTDARTPAQLAQREKMRVAAAAWNALPESEKDRWEQLSYDAGYPAAVNLFYAAFLTALRRAN